MAKKSGKKSNIKLKKILTVTGSIFFTIMYCFMVNGLNLNSEFKIVRTTPAPASEVEIRAQVNYNGQPQININTAQIEELDNLNGVGEKMAQRIIEYRTQNGNFEQIEELMQVPGIGKKTFDGMKDYICVE